MTTSWPHHDQIADVIWWSCELYDQNVTNILIVVREQTQTPVPCPKQYKDYFETFHLINKGDGAKSKHNIGLESHTHGWSPKLGKWYFNMGTNNAYKVYA